MLDPSWEQFATRLARMARDLLSQQSVEETLDSIVTHAVDLVDGCEAAGILTVHEKTVHTLTASGSLVYESDRIQEKLEEGPCFDAARIQHERAFRIEDMSAAQERWPRFAPRALELGVGSMMGLLLFTHSENNLGALNMYSSRPGAFTHASETVGWLLASHAAVAFSSARTHEQLETALASRHTIGEAIGIVMERYDVSEEQAFAILAKSSQDHNIKLREVARTVTETGEVPGARR